MSAEDYEKIANLIKNSFIDYVIQNDTTMSNMIKPLLVDSETTVVNQLEKAKQKYPNNQLLQDLVPALGNRDGSAKSIQLKANVKDAYSENLYVGMMRELRDSNNELNDLYNNIVNVAILQGTTQSAISIRNIIPVEDYAAKIAPIINQLQPTANLDAFSNGIFERNNFTNDDLFSRFVPYVHTPQPNPDTGEYNEKSVRINPNTGEDELIYFLPSFKSMKGVTQTSRKLIALNDVYNSYQLSSDFIKIPKVVTNREGKKINITTGLEITKKDYALMKQKGSQDLYNAYYYKKVYTKAKDEFGNLIPLRTYNKDIDGYDYYYKQINAYGDGNRAVEINKLFTPSVIDNGSMPIQQELDDDDIVNAFAPQVQEESVITSLPVKEVVEPTQVNEESKGSIKMQPDNIAKIKAGTKTITNRTEKEKINDGVYTLPDGTKVEVKLLGKYFVTFDVAPREGYNGPVFSQDEYAKAEGFKDWKDFENNNKFSTNFINGDQDRFVYSIKPVTEQVEPRFEVYGNDVVRTEDGSLAQEYNSPEEAEEGLKEWLALDNQPVVEETNVSPMEEQVGRPSIFDLRNTQIGYTSGQTKALDEISDIINKPGDGYYLLAGYAGTGKTTIAENIAKYAKQAGKSSLVIAPTNKAAKVLNDKLKSTGAGTEATTIHKAIYGEPDPDTGEWVPTSLIKNSVIIIDESSMIDKQLMADLIDNTRGKNNTLIFMGDSYQLQPVGEDSGLFQGKVQQVKNNQTELTEVKRQSLDSNILKVATVIRNDKKSYVPTESTEDFKVTRSRNEFVENFKQAIRNNEDVAMIVATNNERLLMNKLAREAKFGDAAKNILNNNETIISIANSSDYSNSEIFNAKDIKSVSKKYDITFTDNFGKSSNYDVYLAFVTNNDNREVPVLFFPNVDKPSVYHAQILKAARENSPELYAAIQPFIMNTKKGEKLSPNLSIGTYGYAITAHKSQGSQWKKVFVNQNYVADSWDAARWFYTAITRASDEVEVLPSSSNVQISNAEIDSKLNAIVQETPSQETFDTIKDFSDDEKQQILTNFADKHKMTIDQAKSYINSALAKNKQEVINKLKDCY
jgi:AraC-like DNA-binding protein